MAQNKTFEKIQNFIKEKIDSNSNSVVITNITNGFKINDLTVNQVESAWVIKNSSESTIGNFKSRRLAVLTATLIVKKRNDVKITPGLDTHLATLKHDKILFESKISKKFKKELFEDRYSRTVFELSQLYEQINELEKSVGLQ